MKRHHALSVVSTGSNPGLLFSPIRLSAISQNAIKRNQGHGRAGVPRAAAAAAAAPSSAAFGCWRARALARYARAAMHTRRPPRSRCRGQSTTTAAAPPPHLSPLVVTLPSSFMPTLARVLSLSRALSRSRVIMLSPRSRCAHIAPVSRRSATLRSPSRTPVRSRRALACFRAPSVLAFCVLLSLAVMCVIACCICAHIRADVSSLRNAALASPHSCSLAPRSRLLPRDVWACLLCAVITCRHVRHCSLRRLCLLLVCCRHLPSCTSLLAESSPSIPGNQPFRALVCLGHHRRLIARRACPSTRRPTLPGSDLPWSSPPSLTGVPFYQAADPSGLWSALVITAVSDGRAPLPREWRFP